MFQVIVLASILVGIAFIALGVGIFFLPKKSFPETEIGHNKEMKRLGIECAKCSEWRKYKKVRRFKNISVDVARLNLK